MKAFNEGENAGSGPGSADFDRIAHVAELRKRALAKFFLALKNVSIPWHVASELTVVQDENPRHRDDLALEEFEAELGDIVAALWAWDRQDFSDLIPVMDRYTRLVRAADHSTGMPGPDIVEIALREIAEESDQIWPSPWTDGQFGFTILRDINGGSLVGINSANGPVGLF